jgi:enamine deaminase RidA (YjgF/YER057c/UK114 family)
VEEVAVKARHVDVMLGAAGVAVTRVVAVAIVAANPIRCAHLLAISGAIACNANVPLRMAEAVVAAGTVAAHVKISRLFFKAIFFIFLGLLNGYRTHSLYH